MKLRKFIAHAGVCARRKATKLILEGKVQVNKNRVTQVNYEVLATDHITYQGRVLKREKHVYVLLNKPRGFITTLKDERGRKTVRELINYQGPERIYPVGRLDCDTTGVLLFTNNGDLARDLSHPSTLIEKVYHVRLTQPVTLAHLQLLKKGLMLRDGFMKPDSIGVLNGERTCFSVTLHSGKNRIIRRLFEHLGYRVSHLNRGLYAGITKGELSVGSWRFLDSDEVCRLRRLVLY